MPRTKSKSSGNKPLPANQQKGKNLLKRTAHHTNGTVVHPEDDACEQQDHPGDGPVPEIIFKGPEKGRKNVTLLVLRHFQCDRIQGGGRRSDGDNGD